jgi:hypothetical protein
MPQKQNPASGKRQGSGIQSSLGKTPDTAAHHFDQPEFSHEAWLSTRTGVAVSTVKLFCELNRFREVRQ